MDKKRVGVSLPSNQNIWTAGQGGKAAAETILDMRASGDYSKAAAKAYENRWMRAYGHDFGMVRAFPPSLLVKQRNCTTYLHFPVARVF